MELNYESITIAERILRYDNTFFAWRSTNTKRACHFYCTQYYRYSHRLSYILRSTPNASFPGEVAPLFFSFSAIPRELTGRDKCACHAHPADARGRKHT